MWGQVALAVGSSLLSSAMTPEDESWKAEAEKAGVRKAGVYASRDRQLQMLPAAARKEVLSAEAAMQEADRDQAAAQASAAVQAAASGTVGVSVDQTIQQFETTADMVKEQIERTKSARMLQLDQDYADVVWDAEMQNYDVSVNTTGGASTGQRLLAAGIAGATTYLANR